MPETYIITDLYNKPARWRFSFVLRMSELKNWVQCNMTKLKLQRQQSRFLNLSLSLFLPHNAVIKKKKKTLD